MDDDLVEISPKKRFHKLNKIIGEGAFKVVYKAYDVNRGVYVAWNDIPMNKLNNSQKNQIKDEIKLLMNVKDKNKYVLNFYASWFNEEKNTVTFISDLFMCGNLNQFIKSVKVIKLSIVRKWARQILEGLEFLHNEGIIHRDVKCDNIFINGTIGDIVIGDLGIARIMSETGSAKTVLGTPEFMAPEMYDEKYNSSCDIYSFGLTLLEIVTGKVPYSECSSIPQIWKKVTLGEKPNSFSEIPDDSIKSIIEKCIRTDPYERPSINNLLSEDFFVETKDYRIDLTKHSILEKENYLASKTIEQEMKETICAYDEDSMEKKETNEEFSVLEDFDNESVLLIDRNGVIFQEE